MSKLAAFRRGRSLGAKISRGRGRPWGIFFLVSTKLDTFCYPTSCKLHRAACCRFDTIPACDRRTDGQTDGIAVASTALAKRRAVKKTDRVQPERV